MADMLLFGKWNLGEVVVNDAGLKGYINLHPIVIPHSAGKFSQHPVLKARMSVVERFMNKLQVPGHRGKKHKITSRRCPENKYVIMKATMAAFEIIGKKTGKNPVQSLVQAIENGATYEEIASYRLGGIIARKSVTTSPSRRMDLALRYLAQGIYKSSFRSKKRLAESIADEILLAASNDKTSFAVSERQRLEREAEGAR